jgi:hypothetical protein
LSGSDRVESGHGFLLLQVESDSVFGDRNERDDGITVRDSYPTPCNPDVESVPFAQMRKVDRVREQGHTDDQRRPAGAPEGCRPRGLGAEPVKPLVREHETHPVPLYQFRKRSACDRGTIHLQDG